MVRYDERTRQALHAEIWPQSTIGWPAADVKYRFVWTAPLTISPHDHNKVYVGSQFVHMTTDGGKSWQVISPDLTLNDKSRQQMSGGLTPDNVVRAIEEVGPFGLDLCSGVRTDGKLDAAKLKRFFSAVTARL